MSALRAIAAAFACFSRIPMPRVRWDDATMRYLMAAFPLVGAVIGGFELLWGWVSGLLAIGQLLYAAGLALIPIALTGGIHLDGFADVVDARSSHAEPERKRAILKDPHVGAFAIIGIGSYLVGYLALASELVPEQLPLLALAHVVSRCLAGLAVVSFRSSKKEGMFASMGGAADRRLVRVVLVGTFVLVSATLLILRPWEGAACLASAVLLLLWVRRMAEREFGGMSGDLSGYYLQLAELAMLACLVFVGRVA